MKKQLPLALTLLLFICSVALAQEATPSPAPAAKPKPAMTRAQVQRNLVASENRLWEAWSKKDVKPFQVALTPDSWVIGDVGVTSKDDLLKMLPASDCDIKTFTLSDFKFAWLSGDTVVISYKGTQDGTCGGTALPATVWASSVWVRRNGKWYAATHQETPAR